MFFMAPWIDTHAHLDAAEFEPDRAAMRVRARAAGVALCVLPAVAPANFQAVRALAHQERDAYALGIHPLCTGGLPDQALAALDAALERHAADSRLVAVGEIGLDYHVPGLDDERQRYFYREQIARARRHQLPALLHVRRSADLLLAQLRRTPLAAGGIAHAFNGSLQQARAFVDLGFKLGFGGSLTFETALQIRRLAAELPLEALVLETDAPDIPPHWLYRTRAEREAGAPQGRNEPAHLPAIAAHLAGLRGLTLEALAAATTANACAALPRLAPLLAAAQAAGAGGATGGGVGSAGGADATGAPDWAGAPAAAVGAGGAPGAVGVNGSG